MIMPFKHILVSRTDRIGDLILSLPVFQSLKASFPGVKVTALVSPYAREVVEAHPDVDHVELLSRADTLPTLIWKFRQLECDAFLALYPRPTIALAARVARIPLRVGVSYRWWSFLYNKRIPVHRSKCDRHESDYNLDLVRALGAEKLKPYPVFPVSASDREYVRRLLKEKGLAPGERLVVVHPGSKGSALNWKPEKYSTVCAWSFPGDPAKKKRSNDCCMPCHPEFGLPPRWWTNAPCARWRQCSRRPPAFFRLPPASCIWRPPWERPPYRFSGAASPPRRFAGAPSATDHWSFNLTDCVARSAGRVPADNTTRWKA
jgi:hypothetical protein